MNIFMMYDVWNCNLIDPWDMFEWISKLCCTMCAVRVNKKNCVDVSIIQWVGTFRFGHAFWRDILEGNNNTILCCYLDQRLAYLLYTLRAWESIKLPAFPFIKYRNVNRLTVTMFLVFFFMNESQIEGMYAKRGKMTRWFS